jgi:hypothetical protein
MQGWKVTIGHYQESQGDLKNDTFTKEGENHQIRTSCNRYFFEKKQVIYSWVNTQSLLWPVRNIKVPPHIMLSSNP